jgi:hypothetical protein
MFHQGPFFATTSATISSCFNSSTFFQLFPILHNQSRGFAKRPKTDVTAPSPSELSRVIAAAISKNWVDEKLENPRKPSSHETTACTRKTNAHKNIMVVVKFLSNGGAASWHLIFELYLPKPQSSKLNRWHSTLWMFNVVVIVALGIAKLIGEGLVIVVGEGLVIVAVNRGPRMPT